MSTDTAKDCVEPALMLVLHGLASPINIGMTLRVAETFGADVSIIGSESIFSDPNKFSTISDFACGALERKGYQTFETCSQLGGDGRRLIATSIEDGSIELPQFSFLSRDTIFLGNEYDGLPDDIINACSVRLKIPMADVWTPKPLANNPIDKSRTRPVARDGMPNLNVAMTAGIICYQWYANTQHRPAT